MGTKTKWFQDKEQSLAKLHADVGQNQVKVYDIRDYKSKCQIPVHPDRLLEKCTHIEIAVSGEASSGQDWMVIAPYRVDDNSGQKVYDVDPVLTVLDSDSGSPSPSGVVAFHQNFPGRTTDIEGYELAEINDTVSSLRQTLQPSAVPLESGSPSTLNALAYMHGTYKEQFGDARR